MNPYNTADIYKKVEVNTSNRLKVVVMIYDAAIASLKQADECHKRNDLVKRNQFVSRTQFIITELNNSLDLKQGKEIAESLRKLYHFLNRHLNSLLTDNDMKKLTDSLKILENLRDAWVHINQETQSDNSSAAQKSGTGAAIYHPGVV